MKEEMAPAHAAAGANLYSVKRDELWLTSQRGRWVETTHRFAQNHNSAGSHRLLDLSIVGDEWVRCKGNM